MKKIAYPQYSRDIGLTSMPLRQTALSLLIAAVLSACAPMPELGPVAGARAPESFQSTQTFKAPEAEWPNDRWWEKYNDPQLNQLIEEGLAGSPDMKVAAARLQRAEAQSQSTGAALYPHLSAVGSVYGDRTSTTFSPQASPGWYSYGLLSASVTWEIDFWGKNRSALAAAVSESQASRAELADARLLVTSSIAQSYADLAKLAADRITAEKTVDVRTKTWKLFNERQQQGLENVGVVSQAAGKMHQAENDLLQVDVQIAQTRNRLAALVGAGPDRGLQIVPPKTLLKARYELPVDIGINLIGRRPDIVATRWRVEAAQGRIEQRKAAFYPNINLLAMAGLQSLGINQIFQSNSYTSAAGPAIYLPIFEGGKLRADLNAARAENDENVANYEKTLVQALNQVADAAAGIKQLQKEISLADQSVADQTRSVEVATNRYRGGLTNYLSVLTAEDDLLASWRVQTDVQARAFILDVSLIKALGGGYRDDPIRDQQNIKKTEEFPQ